MGKQIKIKLCVIIGFFIVLSTLTYSRKVRVKQDIPLLKQHFEVIKNYKILRHITLPESAEEMLNLDDYFYADYTRNHNKKVNLYIGYYYNANKAYSSHSPLICYPSQGWEIDTPPIKQTISIGSHKLHYEEITTSLNAEKELVLYWYQSHLQTSTQVYRNRIDMAYNKIMGNGEQHAFVRVSVPFAGRNYEQTKQDAINFIDNFYPQFIDFMQ